MRALAFALLVLAACDEAKPAGASGRTSIIEGWKKKGLTTSAFTSAQVAVGKDCQSGTVSGVDVLVCVFPSEDEAKKAEDAGLAWVGDTTGAAQAKGSILVVIADRKKADPSGRTINQMMK
jgi:hypothetical protein